MRPRTRIARYFWILTIVLISCNVLTFLPHTPATPTAVPPTMTNTAQATSTQTPVPSQTPLPTFIVLPTYTPGLPSDQLSCQLLSQSIKNGTHFGPKEDFEMGWLVRNTGADAWEPNNVVFTYFTGTKMYQFSPSRLPNSVDHGDEVALGASLMAPKKSGTYTTVWALGKGNYFFCYVSLRIIVP